MPLKVLWRRVERTSIRHVRVRGNLIVVSKREGIQATRARDGRRVTTSGEILGGVADPSSQLVFSARQIGLEGQLLAINKRSGTRKWSYESPLPITTEPVVVGNSVFVGTLVDHDGPFRTAFLAAVDTRTGREKWFYRAGGTINTPAAGKRSIYVPVMTPDRLLVALDVRTGEKRWAHKVSREIVGSPALTRNLVVFTTQMDGLQALNADTGKPVWSLRTAKSKIAPIASEEFVYAIRGGTHARVLILDPRTGRQLHAYPLEGEPSSNMVLADNRLFLILNKRVLLALGGAE